MPELARFFGIVIRMYFNDHQPAHFHARYGESEALIEIETLADSGAIYRGEPWPWSSNGPRSIGKSYD